MSNKTLRIGLVGAGGNTRRRHIPGFQGIDDVEITVVCNRSESSSQRVADEFGIARIASDWRDVVDDPDIDAICIGTWPYLHAEVTIAALQAGKHVLTEARMARDLTEAKAMMAAAEEHPELIAQIVPAPFSLSHDATIVRLLGELGQLREVVATHRCAASAEAKAPFSWRQDYELSGYNTHTLGILYETVQRWLGPETDPAWLVADAGRFVHQRPTAEGDSQIEVTIPDAVSVLGHYSNGAKFLFDVSSVDSLSPVNEFRLNAERGSLRFNFGLEKLYLSETASGVEKEVQPDTGTAHGWRVEADFVDSIRSQKPVTLTDFADGLRYMRFTEKVWHSWRQNSVTQTWD